DGRLNPGVGVWPAPSGEQAVDLLQQPAPPGGVPGCPVARRLEAIDTLPGGGEQDLGDARTGREVGDAAADDHQVVVGARLASPDDLASLFLRRFLEVRQAGVVLPDPADAAPGDQAGEDAPRVGAVVDGRQVGVETGEVRAVGGVDGQDVDSLVRQAVLDLHRGGVVHHR